MHIAVGKNSSTLRAILTTLILGASTITNASYIKPIFYSNDRINNICFQKYNHSKVFLNSEDSRRDWRQEALSKCQLTPQEIKQSFSKSN